ncbi:MAG: DUF2249 domain-containing protein [Candidatus Rokubacteria bacterium]|nr:DUF2249 domain-containing protein [Candidatus Rokubacteria bacterium]
MAHACGCGGGTPAILDVREMPPRIRHPRIFETFDALAPGQAFVLVNDHDPKPLFYQFQAERPGAFGWRYLEEGPETWRVEITKRAAAAAGAASRDVPKPAALAALPESRQVHLDVRPEIHRGEEPFARIMAAVKSLREGEVLVLRAPFEPVPLYRVLGGRGFAHWTECHGPADWAVWFYREAPPHPVPLPQAGEGISQSAIRLDVRGLEPPHPMVRVLEQLEMLAPGQTLEVLHDRRPMFLYPQLDERGFVHETDEPEPGLVRIVIRRQGGAP